MANKPGLMGTMRNALRNKNGARSAETEEDIDLVADDEETADQAGEENPPEDDGADDAETSAEGETDNEPEDDEEDETGPAARAATNRERARCITIFTHANADAHPNLAMALLEDGTSKVRATKLLNAAGGGVAKSGGSLAERVAASQGDKKPGQDQGATKKSKGSNSMNDRMAAANQNAANRLKNQQG